MTTDGDGVNSKNEGSLSIRIPGNRPQRRHSPRSDYQKLEVAIPCDFGDIIANGGVTAQAAARGFQDSRRMGQKRNSPASPPSRRTQRAVRDPPRAVCLALFTAVVFGVISFAGLIRFASEDFSIIDDRIDVVTTPAFLDGARKASSGSLIAEIRRKRFSRGMAPGTNRTGWKESRNHGESNSLLKSNRARRYFRKEGAANAFGNFGNENDREQEASSLPIRSRVVQLGDTVFVTRSLLKRVVPQGKGQSIFFSDMRQDFATVYAVGRNATDYVNPLEAEWSKKCTAMQEWQTKFYPICNSVHEIDLVFSTQETNVSMLSAGGSWRMAWKIKPLSKLLDDEEVGRKILVDERNIIPGVWDPNITYDKIDDHAAVLKMIRIDRDYTQETYRYHIADAIAMERLSSSPYVIDEYAFCGQSAVTEYADGTARSLIKRTDKEGMKPRERLVLARNLALGLADIHGIDHPNGRNATFTHNDINLANLARVHHSTIKFNDFNIGIMMKWDTKENMPCGFPALFESPLWRSPEEIRNNSYVTEKIDLYSLGNVFFQLLTRHQPWTWLEPGGRLSLQEVTDKKLRGELPTFPDKFSESANMAHQALYIATLLCYKYNPEERPSARQLANSLSKAVGEFQRFKDRERKELTFAELREIFIKK